MSYNIPRILFELKRPKAYSLYIIQLEVKYIDDGNGRYIRVRTALFARARARRVFPRCYGSPAADDLGRQRKGTANKRTKQQKKTTKKKNVRRNHSMTSLRRRNVFISRSTPGPKLERRVDVRINTLVQHTRIPALCTRLFRSKCA